MKRPNNFPREGKHKAITQDEIKRLQRERPVLNAKLHYTIGGDAETVVHSNLMSEREAAITNGARRLQHASDQTRRDFGVAKPDARTEYIRKQLAAARGLGSRLIDCQSQKMTAAAKAIADRKTLGHLS